MTTTRLDDQDMMLLRCAQDRMTFREMAEQVDRAVSVVHTRVSNLQELGLLTRPGGKARSVMLTQDGESLMLSAGFKAKLPF